MSFPPYPKYKPSGVEWLGDVPEHWELKRLKHNCRVFPSNVDKKANEGETTVRLCNYTDVYYNDSITCDLDFMEATATEDQIDRFTLLAGDTVITKDSESPDDIAVAAHVPFTLEGVICGYHLAVVRPTEGTVGNFIKRFFDSRYAKSSFATLANGLTRHALGQYELKNVVLATPPLAEQTEIAAFLDRETGKIDELVAEQRRLIELLKEKRQAVISHAVTRGLNPNAPTKPSGIQWLGNIPEHWEVASMKRRGKLLTEKTERRLNPLGLENIQGWTGRLVQTDTVFEGDGVEFQSGDILFGKLRPYLAKVYVAESDGEAVGDFHVIRPTENLSSRFAQYTMLSREFIDIVDGSTFGSKMPRASWDFVGGMKVGLPGLREQTQIVNYLDAETAKLDALTAEAERAIELLQER
ncbi:MAG TPA: restriction endonuclease subunit S, partial [Pyrinomonadaceae bacterium]|nr:restriction endonuclease subunit S [Pyrinomonadaceae bacterium]